MRDREWLQQTRNASREMMDAMSDIDPSSPEYNQLKQSILLGQILMELQYMNDHGDKKLW
jgi:Fe-S-cluster formation regulator IscX/YfhJ